MVNSLSTSVNIFQHAKIIGYNKLNCPTEKRKHQHSHFKHALYSNSNTNSSISGITIKYTTL